MLNVILLTISITLMYAAPIILAALGGVISERAGVVNIGLEGIMTIGAFAGAAAAFYLKNPWAGLLFAGLAGAILALLHAVASVTFKANQTISGIALNFIGPGLALFLCRMMFEGGTMSKTLTNKLPKVLSFIPNVNNNKILATLNVDSTVVLSIALAAIMWFVLYKTKWGLRVMSVGEHPAAADTLGINVYLIRYTCVILSGVLAGFGGAARSIAVVSQFSPGVISGHGFIALAAVIFGKWTPHGAVGACLLFGFAQALVVIIGGTKIPIPSQFISMLPYLLTLVILILFVGKSVAPKADGVPYEKGAR